jgi:hypothetical protein
VVPRIAERINYNVKLNLKKIAEIEALSLMSGYGQKNSSPGMKISRQWKPPVAHMNTNLFRKKLESLMSEDLAEIDLKKARAQVLLTKMSDEQLYKNQKTEMNSFFDFFQYN